MASNDAGLGWLIIIAFALLYWIVMIIIEYFVLFLILGLIIWAIYYYSSNAPKWEQQRKVRDSFSSNNTKSHNNFKVLYRTAEHNIKVLGSSCFALPDNYAKLDNGSETELFDLNFKKDIVKFSNTLKSVSRYLAQPGTLYKEGMGVNHNPYISPTTTVSSLIDETIKIPNIILSLEKKCLSLWKKDVLPNRLENFYNILRSISSGFTIDNHNRLHLIKDYNSDQSEISKSGLSKMSFSKELVKASESVSEK